MSLEKLIEKGRLEPFTGASDGQVKNKLSRGLSYLSRAKKIFSTEDENDDRNAFVHSNIYLALQMISHAYLLTRKYRSKGYGQHETNIIACRLLMADAEMNNVFDRLDILRKNRNKINYGEDLLDVSNTAIEQAIDDVSLFANKVESFIDNENSQQQIL